jgi:hypothetical protein
MKAPRFTREDAEAAFNAWGCNCGPAAIAAITGLTLFEVRPFLGDFEQKRYTNPTLMWEILGRLGVVWKRRREPLEWPTWGLARIQWHGPWSAPGVSPRAAYRYTHWVGSAKREDGTVGVFDVNALANGSGWTSLNDWSEKLVPWILKECVQRAERHQIYGRWSLTHSVEVEVLA